VELFTNWHSAPGQDKAAAKEAYLRACGMPRATPSWSSWPTGRATPTLRNLAPARQHAYYTETIAHIVPLASSEPWFRYWYASWRAEFVDLAAPISDTSSQTNRPTGYTK
jgi:guanosine-3',5'-bis(diphosphate) 3'-pyrophosphohydrolase